MGDVTSGATDVANELAQNRASHHPAIASLQVVRAALEKVSIQQQKVDSKNSPVELFRLPIVEAQAAVLHLLPVHDDGNTSQ